jgi:hypothetical protein
MKGLIGVVLILLGITGGIYVGFWLCFIGGIIQVVEQIRAENMDSTILAFGIAKFFLAGLSGWLCCIIPCGIGCAMLKDF